MSDKNSVADGAGSTEEEYPSDPRTERILKVIVIGLGVLLVVGIIVLVTTIAYRASKMKTKGTSGPGFGELTLQLTPGETVRSVEMDGNRMAIETASEIILLDTRKGLELGRIKLKH